VVNEFGDFVGVLTMTDILESIAGELPDASEIEGPDVIEDNGGFVVSGALNLARCDNAPDLRRNRPTTIKPWPGWW
jgi:CBS domain containing-hemolysin-like protein